MIEMTELETKAMQAVCTCCDKRLCEIDLYAFRHMSPEMLEELARTGIYNVSKWGIWGSAAARLG